MKKTLLSLMLLVFSICSMYGALNVVQDTLSKKQDSVLAKTIPPVPLPPHDNQQYHYNVNDEVPHAAYIIPIAFFLFVIGIIAISQSFAHKRNKLRTELYIKFLEQGKEIPENLIVQQKTAPSNLKRGIILISIGLGVSIFLFADSPGSTDWTLGIIPLLIGAGYLVVYKLSGKTEAKNTNA
jgi:hypothetical protein